MAMSDDRDLSALYQSADKPQPPAKLDKAVRAAAHKAVKRKRSHAPQWLGGIAASLFAALLITQMMPVVEQEAVSTQPGNLPRPAADSVEPGMELREAAPAAEAPAPAPLESKPDRARTGNQFVQEKLEVKQSQVRKKAVAGDEVDALSSPGMMLEDAAGLAVEPKATPTARDTALQTIIDLLDAGKTREAKQQLADFRKRYPEAEVPDSITRRLESSDTE